MIWRETEVRATVTWHTETMVAQAPVPEMNGAARAFVDGPLPIEDDAQTRIRPARARRVLVGRGRRDPGSAGGSAEALRSRLERRRTRIVGRVASDAAREKARRVRGRA